MLRPADSGSALTDAFHGNLECLARLLPVRGFTDGRGALLRESRGGERQKDGCGAPHAGAAAIAWLNRQKPRPIAMVATPAAITAIGSGPKRSNHCV